jgi:hypothetical protein
MMIFLFEKIAFVPILSEARTSLKFKSRHKCCMLNHRCSKFISNQKDESALCVCAYDKEGVALGAVWVL